MSFINHFQPYPLYTVLILSICYFVAQIILSNITHALTLQMALNHMLCNILALAGSIMSIKRNDINIDHDLQKSAATPNTTTTTAIYDKNTKTLIVTDKTAEDPAILEAANADKIKARELRTRCTFGWARIEVLTMLIVFVTLTSLSLALLCSALQTLVHIEHEDTMHLPVHVIILGCVGLMLHGFTYFTIGGYTSPQGSFLHINPNNGRVTVEPSNVTQNFVTKTVTDKQSSKNDQQLKEDLKDELGQIHYRTRREGFAELLRDVSTTIFFIVCAVIVHYSDDKEHTAKFIDPILSIFSLIMVGALSYPYMKEACLILLQTIPDHIDMDNFENTLKTEFPEIESFHDLHIWQLTPQTYIATVHIIFKNSTLYVIAIENVRAHFHKHRIAHVTIQPEFNNEVKTASKECLLQCKHPECVDKVCCTDSITALKEITVCSGGKSNGHGHSHNHGHSHGHGHSHDHAEHNHQHSHKHTSIDSNEKPQVPIAIEEKPKETTDISSKMDVNKNVDRSPNEAIKESSSPPSPTVILESNVETSDESSSVNVKPPKVETETADITQTNIVTEMLSKPAMPSIETVDQTTSDNTKV